MEDIGNIRGKITKKKLQKEECIKNLNNLKQGTRNEYYFDRNIRDIDFYEKRINEIDVELEKLYADERECLNHNIMENLTRTYIQKEIELLSDEIEKNEKLNNLNINYEQLSEMLKYVKFSKNLHIYYDEEYNRYIFKDDCMLIDSLKYNSSDEIDKAYKENNLLITIDDKRKIWAKYNQNLKFNLGGTNDYIEEHGRLFIRTNGILIINENDNRIKGLLNDKYNKYIKK